MSDSFAILVPVGKTTQEMFRLRFLLKSIVKHEPTVRWIVIIDDDSLHERRFDQLLPKFSSCELIVLKNPRNGLGNGFLGGLTVGVLYGLSWAYYNTSASFVLKMDTDALVIAPFAINISQTFAEGDRIGQIGTIGRTCNRSDPSYNIDSLMISPLVAILEAWPHNSGLNERYTSIWPDLLDDAWVAPFNKIRHHIARAISFGYSSLSYCQGGAYAVGREMLRRLSDNHCFVDYHAWAGIPIGEDVVISMYTYSVAMKLCDQSLENQTFGLHWEGLPFDPKTLISKNFAIIHSLKNNPSYKENMIYSFFV